MLKNIINRITGRRPEQEQAASSNPAAAEMTPDQFKQLVLDVARTKQVELGCNSTFELLDEYADLVAGGQNAEESLPLVKHHIEMCPDCRDEYETLLEIVKSIGAKDG